MSPAVAANARDAIAAHCVCFDVRATSMPSADAADATALLFVVERMHCCSGNKPIDVNRFACDRDNIDLVYSILNAEKNAKIV